MDEGRIAYPLPDAFVKRVGGQLGEELPAFLQAMEESPRRGLRMNPLRTGWETPFRDAKSEIPWMKGAWTIPASSSAGITIAHEAGAFYLQEPCAMIPAAVMEARPGERILDLCAAPGGKSTQMGCAMRGNGLLVCNEPVPQRAAVLSRNIERMGIPNAMVTCAYPDSLAERWPGAFDGVMVDAPCSGEGMFRRHPETRMEWTPEKAEGCAARQKEILDAAARMVRPGGRLVYATCTWNPAENERQVKAFLEKHPEFSLEPFALPGGVDGREGFFTAWLHRMPGEGQFVAKLRKCGLEETRRPDGSAAFPVPPDLLRAWRENGVAQKAFSGENEKLLMPNVFFGGTLVFASDIPDLKGIRVLRLGLHLGQMKGKVFQPDHAWAMAMNRPAEMETALDGKTALKYLAGEVVSGEARGWTVMTWHGLALGWGKGSDGMIKNHYPKGLRNTRLIE